MKLRVLAATALVMWGMGCQSTYYTVWEKLGWEKRDILIDRVEEARDEQQAAKEQFKTTLERLQELTNVKGGALEAKYKKLNTEYEESKERAEAVTARINSVDKVATDLFAEWKEELSQYENPELKRSSEEKLRASQERYKQLLAAMRKSEASMTPVLRAFGDQVLFLKHNLNAQAVTSLEATAEEIRGDVQNLIKEMEASIAEANAFIGELKN